MIEVTKAPQGTGNIIPEGGPDSYVMIDSLRYPIVAWRWDGERGHPLVAFEDGVWEVEWVVVQEICVRGQMMRPRPDDDYDEETTDDDDD